MYLMLCAGSGVPESGSVLRVRLLIGQMTSQENRHGQPSWYRFDNDRFDKSSSLIACNELKLETEISKTEYFKYCEFVVYI